jgi:hypothetical protein
LAHLYAVKREHDKLGLPFLTKGMTHQVTKSLGMEYILIHGPEALAPRKREALTPTMKCQRCLGPIRQWWVSSCRSVLG